MQIRHFHLTPKVIEGLYTEAMVLADEARSYFDSERARQVSPVEVSVAFSCEILKGYHPPDACHCLAVEPESDHRR